MRRAADTDWVPPARPWSAGRATVAALLSGIALASPACTPAHQMQPSAMTVRTVDARLPGEEFRPLHRGTTPLEHRAAAARLLLAGHTAGFAGWVFPALELGREHDVVVEATRTLARRQDYAALVSLSAAYLRTPSSGEDLARVAQAADAATRATLLAPSRAEGWFNRAAALDRLGLSPVIEPWSDYLGIDNASPWAVEAANRARRAAEQSGGAGSESIRLRLENDILPLWAGAVGRGDEPAIAALTTEARTAASQLRNTGGDGLLDAVVGQLEHATRSERQALADVINGIDRARQLLDLGRPTEGCPAVDRFAAQLATLQPAGRWAQLFVGNCHYYRADYASARTTLSELMQWAAAGGYSSLAGRAAYLLGAVEVRDGQAGAADRRYREAREWLASAGEASFLASTLAITARQAHEQGDDATAWDLLRDAFGRWRGVSGALHAYTLLSTASRMALDAGLDGLAYDLSAAQLRAAEATRVPSLAAEAVAASGAILARADRMGEARAAIDEAYRRLDAVPDREIRLVSAGLVNTSAAEAVSVVAPCEAVEKFRTALEALSGRLAQTRARLLLRLGDALERCGRGVDAAQVYGAGMDALERVLGTQGPGERSISHADRLWDLYGKRARLQAEDLGQVDEGFSTLMRGRSAWLGKRQDQASPSHPRDRLGDNAVVAYLVLDQRVYAWALTAKTSTFRRLPIDARPLTALVERWTGGAGTNLADREVSRQLYKSLIAPVQHVIGEAPLTGFLPDGPLYAVPFSALWTGHQYLVERTAIWMPVSLDSFDDAGRARAGASGPLLIANPKLDPGRPERVVALPSAEREAAEIARLYQGARVLAGDEATKSAVLSALADAGTVHVAAHAIVDLSRPFDSRIALAGDGRADLTVRDLMDGDGLALRLVVLASCRSAAGRPMRGFGATGLASVLAHRVSEAAVGTLWDIDDTRAVEVSRELHQRLASGVSVAEAIRGMQLAMIGRRDQYSGPGVWAAMVGVGRPTTTAVNR